MSYRNCVSSRATRVFFLSIVLNLLLFLNLSGPALCGPPDPRYPDHSAEIQWIQLMNQPTQRALNPRPDLLPRGKDGDWQPMIDAVWGPGFPGAEQATVLQNFMTIIDEDFATFVNGYDVDIDDLIAPYLSEVNAGVSRGRFQGIMNLARTV